MNRDEFEDQDARAAWELLGRHRGVEPSFGFAQRTLRRLHEKPARRFWQLPVFRWATALSCVIALAVGGLVLRHRAESRQAAEFYAAAHQDYLEDYDVIAALDQLEVNNQL
ncbi:MAG: hypothetical protein PCFJNLEI_00785 [Verrucomicrobiae bacterium]|nr:hypothetical protein [Verrucomicrobiae bacterium]